jgi:hypothetical protein
MLFNTTHEFLLAGRTEKVTAHCPGINDRLQWQPRKQFRRVFGTGRISECREISKENAGSVEGHTIGSHGTQF